ncbi:MAG TPA: insulinase family protein [Cyclobacteriaceae bacterium]|nr:insulinase family protein [Cyclobacteriaceae bacterium]
MNIKSLFVRLLVLLFVANISLAQTRPENQVKVVSSLTDKLPVAPEIIKGTLPNGLTYYIRKNTKPEKKVELRMAVKVGSILEDDDQRGLAHFTEHMAFNGTQHFKKNDLVSFLQSIGVKFGADLNASTGFDETVYILPIPVDKPENLEQGMLVLEDWASTISFDPAEIEKERGVVLEEERLGKGAQERMLKKMLPYILEGSKYEVRLPIGTTETLKTFKPEVIKRFYKDWYRPDLMAVVVVGDVDPVAAEAMIKKHFEKLKNPAKERPRVDEEIPTRTKSEGLVITDPEATNHILQIFYATNKAKVQTTVGDYRQSIIKNLASVMLSQRMQELTQKSDPPFLFGGSDRGEFIHNYESYFGFAVLGKAGVAPAINAVILENERAKKFGFTAAELDRAKKSMLRNMERAYNERDKTESENYADEYVRNFTSDEPIPGIENEYNYYKEFIPNITLEEINAFTARNIPAVTEHKLVVLAGPEKADFPMPTNAELLAMVTEAEKLPVTAYEEKAVAANLMGAVPEGGRVVFDKKNAALGLSELTLGNGVKVIMKPTDFKNDEVILSGFRFGGQSTVDNANALNAQYASTLVTQMGIGDFSPTDLRKVLAGKSVSVAPRLSNYSEGINGQAGTADLETMLQLVHLYFTKPRKDEELFKSFVTRQEAAVQNAMSDPRTVFQDSVQKMLYNFNPRGPRFPRKSDFSKLDLDKSLAIYKERFGNARGWTFYLVGSFDPAKVKPLVASYLGTLPAAAEAPGGFKDLGLRPVKGVVKKDIKKGNEPKSFINIVFSGEATYSDEEQLKLQALMELMNIKLIESLREDLGGIYGGGMNGSLNKNPYGNYLINVSLPCGPENVDKLVKATFAEIDKIKANGPTEADLNKVKETFDKEYKESIKENGYWAARLQRSAEMGTDPADILTVNTRFKALTAKDLQEAAKKYFNMNNYFQGVLYPEK